MHSVPADRMHARPDLDVCMHSPSTQHCTRPCCTRPCCTRPCYSRQVLLAAHHAVLAAGCNHRAELGCNLVLHRKGATHNSLHPACSPTAPSLQPHCTQRAALCACVAVQTLPLTLTPPHTVCGRRLECTLLPGALLAATGARRYFCRLNSCGSLAAPAPVAWGGCGGGAGAWCLGPGGDSPRLSRRLDVSHSGRAAEPLRASR